MSGRDGVASPELQAEEDKGSRRRRTKTSRFEFDFLDNEEQRLLQQALKVSKKETKRVEMEIPDALVFYPTAEEFMDPLIYIQKIRSEAEQYGICKIVPPPEWNPSCQVKMSNPKMFPTKLQDVHTLQEGQGFDEGKNYNIATYKEMADKFKAAWIEKHYPPSASSSSSSAPSSSSSGATSTGEPTHEQLAKDYWDMVETRSREASVEYANDIDTAEYASGFHRNDAAGRNAEKIQKDEGGDESYNATYYASSGWNLNNIPKVDLSVLKHLKTPVNGVNVPWLYIGMLFSSFCWHNEDNYFYSINYSHFGPSDKQWYGVPGADAKKFEQVSKDFLLELFRESPDLLHHMTTQISPSLLKANGVPVYKVTQEPKTFIVTFPKSFHCGFSYGFNCGEAVNFATIDWLVAGGEAEERYRSFSRGSVFSHQRLLLTLFHHKDEIDMKNQDALLAELLKVLDEEIHARPYIYGQGVRNIADSIRLPTNEFHCIDKKAVEYDDMRACCLCKHVCVFSAVACECDQTRVACIRHWKAMCKCQKEKKFVLEWAHDSALRLLQTEMTSVKASLKGTTSEKKE
jgi:hypothetical protein